MIEFLFSSRLCFLSLGQTERASRAGRRARGWTTKDAAQQRWQIQGVSQDVLLRWSQIGAMGGQPSLHFSLIRYARPELRN